MQEEELLGEGTLRLQQVHLERRQVSGVHRKLGSRGGLRCDELGDQRAERSPGVRADTASIPCLHEERVYARAARYCLSPRQRVTEIAVLVAPEVVEGPLLPGQRGLVRQAKRCIGVDAGADFLEMPLSYALAPRPRTEGPVR